MSTNIAFLEELREDLLDAGWRESLPKRGGARAGRRFGGRWLVAVAAVFGLAVVTGVGMIATGEGPAGRRLLDIFEAQETRPGAMASPAPAREPESVVGVGYSSDEAGDQAGRGALSEAPGLAPQDQLGGEAQADAATTRDVSVGELSLIVKTGRLAIVVERDAFAERFQGAMDVAASNGGYVQTSTTQGDRFGSLVIRVPSDRFETTVRELKELGTKVEGESVSGDDVTAEYVDLRARLHIAKSRRAVLERLMNRAVSIDQTIRVQNALDEVQLRIEQYQGSLNVLEDKVSEATIRLQIREPGAQPLEQDAKNPSLPGALDRAVAGFFSVIAGTVVGLGYLIPALIIGVALFLAVRFARRRFA